jgi:antibiotic biosynthesis monooxygenase (ABM) superfamily enzyme
MNDSTKSPEYKTSQPATAIASHRVLPDKVTEYCAAQTALTDAARRFPGFVGTEVLSPVAGLQDEWVAIFRLESNQAMKRWLQSPERTKLVEQIEQYLSEPLHLLILASDDRTEPPVAEVFTHLVRKERVADYLAWRRKAITAQAFYPGYLATEFFEPREGQEEWVDIVRYNSLEHLDAWQNSKPRADLLKELDSIVESRHEHRVTGLEGWFALNRAPGELIVPPPPWKQAFSVLFALYPTVMILAYLTNPFMKGWSLPVSMMIGNVLGVIALTWLVMPWVTRWLSFWLDIPVGADNWKKEVLGVTTVVGILALLVIIFRALDNYI